MEIFRNSAVELSDLRWQIYDKIKADLYTRTDVEDFIMKAFRDFAQAERRNYITLSTGEYYPDILANSPAVENSARKGDTALVIGAIPPNLILLPNNLKPLGFRSLCCRGHVRRL